MKRLLFTLFAGCALTGSAQGIYQIPNSGFDTWNSEDEPGNGWNSFSSAQASGLAALGKSSAPKPVKEAGRSGSATDFCAKIWSKSIFGAKANGNLTTGCINMGSTTPTDPSNHNFTKRDDANHSLRFAGRPDAVEFYAKFTSGGSPNGRGQFILHGDVDYRDPEIAEQEASKVGIASVPVTPTEEWTRFTGEFTYLQDTPATQYMLASFTTNPTPGGSANDNMWIDDVKLLYYHALENVSYKGHAVAFNADNHCDLPSAAYGENGAATISSDLKYTKVGAGATVEAPVYDANSAILTITVKGNDFAVNPDSYTTYTIQLRKPLHSVLTEAAFDGETVTLKENETVTVNHIYKKEKLTLVCGSDKDATVEQSYDTATGILTIKVTGSDVADYPGNVHTYKIQFNLPLHSVLSKVTYKGTEVALGDNGETHLDGCYEEDGFQFFCEADPNARIEQSYDDATCTLTVTVTGSDVAENPENVHTYKFVFAVPTGIRTLSLTSGYDVHTLSGVQLRKGANSLAGLPKGIYIVNGRKVAIH